MPSFFVRNIAVDVDVATWGRKAIPQQLRNTSGTTPIDVGEALLLLGNLTMPCSLSPASPALFWAWVRYYLALFDSQDLRITKDFADLDPHLKGILSDDFGVAIATQWMVDRFGPMRIIHGRQFINLFPELLRRRNRSKAKVGVNKAPDFVMVDRRGKWHVLECKGTQTSRAYQRDSLNTAIAQKHGIEIIGSLKGQQLAAGLYIGREGNSPPTHLKIIDPEEPPLIQLTTNNADEMEANADRLAVAQVLGTIGLTELAIELSLPPSIDLDSEFLLPSEIARMHRSREDRLARARTQARDQVRTSFTRNGRTYEGREINLEIPRTASSIPFRRAVIIQGVIPELIEEVSAASAPLDEDLDARVKSYAHEAWTTMVADSHHIALTYGSMFYSEIVWK